jgi:hypothetical protein
MLCQPNEEGREARQATTGPPQATPTSPPLVPHWSPLVPHRPPPQAPRWSPPSPAKARAGHTYPLPTTNTASQKAILRVPRMHLLEAGLRAVAGKRAAIEEPVAILEHHCKVPGSPDHKQAQNSNGCSRKQDVATITEHQTTNEQHSLNRKSE